MKTIHPLEWYASIFNQHHYETEGFTWDYEAANDDDVFWTKPVDQKTIDFLTTVMVKITKPEKLPELKKNIAYLIGLRHRQQVAWTNKLAEFDNRLNNTAKWVQEHTQ
jgi:hypothetical protein